MFLEILNIVLPVFAVIGLGFLLRRWQMIDQPFIHQTNRLVFYVALPLLLFYKIGTADFFHSFNATLAGISVVGLLIAFAGAYVWGKMRSYPASTLGAFTQGAFRGNLAYVGLAMVFNAYGEEGLTRAGLLMGFLVPVLNLLAICALLLPQQDRSRAADNVSWLKQLALNPLIIASALGVLWSFYSLPMPLMLERSLHIASGMALPLALLAIGASFSLEKLRGDLMTAFFATGIKLIWLPLLTAGLLHLTGVTGLDFAIGVLLAATPAATANYIFAQQLGGDAELSGSIVMMSTLSSCVTYTIILLLLRSFEL
ncbi:MAG: AEC family transporter [Desulfuromonas sp.]|nr:MAG: AEC family transporter [Desulfuromonas sp.]